MATENTEQPQQSDGPNPNSKSAGKYESSNDTRLYPDIHIHLLAKKEAKRLEKEAKLAAKNAKKVAAPATLNNKGKDAPAGKKEKPKDDDQVFVNTTPKGHKKGAYFHRALCNKNYLNNVCCRCFRANAGGLQPTRCRSRVVRLVARFRIFQAPIRHRRRGKPENKTCRFVRYTRTSAQRYWKSPYRSCFDYSHSGHSHPLVRYIKSPISYTCLLSL
jgi:hypothetical protein